MTKQSPLILLVLLTGLALFVIPVAAASGTISVADIQVSGDSEFSVPVIAEGFSDVGAVLFDVTYGSRTMSFVRAEPGMAGPDLVMEAREINPGVIEIGFLNGRGMSGSGTIAQLKFRANDGTDGSGSSVNLAIVEAYDTNGRLVQISSTGGMVKITGTGDGGTLLTPKSSITTKTSLDFIVVLVAFVCLVFIYRIKKQD